MITRQKRPSNPDCVLFLDHHNDMALTTYYKQESNQLWSGGIGLHRFSQQAETLVETRFDFFGETGGIFDLKAKEEADNVLTVSATVDKKLLLHELKLPNDSAPSLDLLHSEDLQKPAVYVDLQ